MDLFDRLRSRLAIPVKHADRDALVRETATDGAADRASAACHNCRHPVETAHADPAFLTKSVREAPPRCDFEATLD
jgi:hypothetical protein